MSEIEYLRGRIHVLEAALRNLMELIQQAGPRRTAEDIVRLNWDWGREIDALDLAAKADAESALGEKGGDGE